MQHGYVPPTLTVDSVVFQVIDRQLSVLLIHRARDPFAGWWALPGGYCAAGETTREAMGRVLLHKAGVQPEALRLVEQLYTFDTVARDPRGHAVSVTYMGLGHDVRLQETGDTQSPRFFPIDALPELAYDHHDIIGFARTRLQSLALTTTAISALLPAEFTLTQLQQAYEAVLSRPLDKRNFRKRFLAYDAIEPTGTKLKDGAHRPAMLYRFRGAGLLDLARSFE